MKVAYYNNDISFICYLADGSERMFVASSTRLAYYTRANSSASWTLVRSV